MKYRGIRGEKIAAILADMNGHDPRDYGTDTDKEGSYFTIGTAYRLAVAGLTKPPEPPPTHEET